MKLLSSGRTGSQDRHLGGRSGLLCNVLSRDHDCLDKYTLGHWCEESHAEQSCYLLKALRNVMHVPA